MKKLRSSGLASVLLLSLFACSDEDSALPGADDAAADPAPDAEVSPLSAGPELDWRNCGQFEDRNLECAEVEVPIDYELPDGDKLPIAVRRIQADPLEPYHGALLYNPGGPGGEGIDDALSLVQNGLFDAIAPGYDIIGFDPRGVASSGETGCGMAPQNMYPGATPAGAPVLGNADYVAYFQAEGERCEREWGPLFRKLGSNNVVRDMEEIRKALGQPTLNFLGASYGTRIGSLYAHQYPETTGRMVLDAAMDPQGSTVELVRGQFYQEVATQEWLMTSCESGELTCPPNPRVVFDQAVQNARQRGLELNFVGTWTGMFAAHDAPARLVTALASEAADPGGDWILEFLGAGGGGGGGLVAFYGVMCTDDDVEPPTLADLDNLRAEFTQVSPLFAEVPLITASACAGWPVTRDPIPVPTALDAPPLLVIGGVADSRTPYPWSQAMTEALGNATLLTSGHFGHVALGTSECVMSNIRAYLASGSLPASGAACP